ncbi:precorrin-6y C5,15-methyltransferase (decarboxylating) subunit CbiE [Elstera litoralis]|uniref:precorrin-6y C5,15-methyltransferase (decarboxylating) subunit CbiE n=1 Tax=Elstera litoralis TaxID=552518 RepID=UPI000A53B494
MVEDAPVPRPWLSLIGIGEDGQEGLSASARHLLAQADWIWGGARHLAMVPDHSAVKTPWPRPFSDAIPALLAQRGERVCVLASGDPFYFGVGSLLAEHLTPGEYQTVPAPSSLSLAAARLGWSQQDCTAVTLHGRPLERIIPHLTPTPGC